MAIDDGLADTNAGQREVYKDKREAA